MDVKIEQRIFRKFSQWYYIEAKKDMPIPDAPELVALLQAVGFQLSSMGFSGKENCVGRPPAALKVTIECGVSGVVAELRAPAESPCRCNVFSNKQEAQEEQQASFWTITTSQEKMSTSGAIGSSLLPEICDQRAKVIKEVFQLLQDELFVVPFKNKMGSQRRLSLPPVSKLDAGANAIMRSVDTLELKTEVQNEWNGSIPAVGLNVDDKDSALMRRASFGCGADLKNVAPLPPKLPAKLKQLPSNSSLAESDADPIAVPVANNERIRKLLLSALELLGGSKSASGAGKPQLERRTTFVMPHDDETLKDPARKRPKFASTPGSVARGGSTNRVATPKPDVSNKIFATTPATALPRTSLRSTQSSPMASMIPGASAARARTAEVLRRRSYVAGSVACGSGRLRSSVLSPKAELNESNCSSTGQTPKSKLVKRASLPPRPTYTKEHRLA